MKIPSLKILFVKTTVLATLEIVFFAKHLQGSSIEQSKQGSLPSSQSTTFAIPQENLIQGVRPDMKSAEIMAERLLGAISRDEGDSSQDLFFPQDAFMALKDMPGAGAYYNRLVKWFKDDIHREHLRLKSASSLRFIKLKPGFCKWKAVGTEYNKVAYWSCYRAEISASAGDRIIAIPVKSMINWGANWYITHLGPMPKKE